jgi:cytochrome oxidase Cu insertion factor (SCO1/SenC/PrrC family)
MLNKRILRILLLAIPMVLAAAAVVWYLGPPAGGAAGSDAAGAGRVVGVGGPIALVDQNGKAVTQAEFGGKYALIFFGYANCPDICPTELAAMSAALDKLGPGADEVVPVFITVDPERDTPETLKGYVGLYHPRLIGLTGTPGQVEAATRAFRVFAQKVWPEGSSDYLMDHSTYLYLMDRNWRLVDVIPGRKSPDELAARLGKYVAA